MRECDDKKTAEKKRLIEMATLSLVNYSDDSDEPDADDCDDNIENQSLKVKRTAGDAEEERDSLAKRVKKDVPEIR